MRAPALAQETTITESRCNDRGICSRGIRVERYDRKDQEQQPSEWTQLRENQVLFTYLHLAPDPEQAKGLMKSGCTGIAYETVTDAHGGLPLLAPMSEVAGGLAIEATGAALKTYAGDAAY